MIIGGGTGALIGWGAGAAASALGAALTLSSSGALGLEIYKDWKTAEEALRRAMNSVSDHAARILYTPYGNRIVDS